MNEIRAGKKEDGAKQFFSFPELGVVYFRAFIPRGTKQEVYRKSPDGKGILDPDSEGMAKLKTITVIPPGSYIRYHSEALDRPAEWPGTWELVAGGLHPVGNYTAEAVNDSHYLCVSPMGREFFATCSLARAFVPKGETYVFGATTKGCVFMAGDFQNKGFTAKAGDQFTASQDTLIALVEDAHV